MPKGTVALEEAVLEPAGLARHAKDAALYAPGTDVSKHPLTAALQDIHGARLEQMDAEGVEYMLLSLTSPGPQGEPDPAAAAEIARTANDWLAVEVGKNPSRFGALASLSMHNPAAAAAELRRAVVELGCKGAILNDYQTVVVEDGGEAKKGKEGKILYDGPEYHVFWREVERLDVPVYMHPRYRTAADLHEETGGEYARRRYLLGAAVQFHLDLSFHLYALMASGVLDVFPGVKIVAGHLGEGIPFNLWRASHWYNQPVKKATRPSKEDYMYYFKNNVYITTSGDFSTAGLKFCIGEIGVERCMYAIDYPYDKIKEAQDWWKGVDLPADQKEAVARANAIKLFKLPLAL